MDQDASDIGRAWEDALDKYCKDTGTNIKYLPQMKWNVDAIMGEQQRQVETFNKYRHNKGMTDKFRTLISKNSNVIQAVANNVANSASAAFPPSAAILTAFTYVMKASKNVSDDYDQVAAFFEIMGSLMERLSLLETKLPSAKNYKTILMRVFSSLMGLCGTATKYVTEGRFKHWLKALYKGTDDEIKGEYSKLETNIQRLESATMFATLATVMETKTDVKDLTAMTMQSLKVGNQTLAVSTQSLSVGLETQSMVGGMSLKQTETLTAIKKLERRILQKEESQKDADKDGAKGKTKDSGAKKNAALNLVKTTFATAAEPAIQLKEIQTSFVQGTFTWISQEESFKSFMDGDSPFLWLYGPPGIGKSCMAYSIIGKLLEATSSDSRSSVAYFFFKEEHEELRSVKNMLSAAVIQTAIGDGKYRDEVVADLKTNGEELPVSVLDMWKRFFAERYPKDADQKLIIVLDGLDEAEKEDREQILELLKQVKKDELSVQFMFTSRQVEDIEKAMTELEPSKVEINKSKISVRGGDLWKIIMKRCKTLSKLKRLQKPALRKIGTKLRIKADSILYVEHMLRRLNAIGRESLIFKELDKLPEDLHTLYELLLSECQKDRSKEQLTALKKLFAWLAYSKRPLTLGEATSLVKVVPGANSFSLEEEIDGRSARILDLATEVADDGSNAEESDSELNEKQSDEEGPSDSDNSITSPLKFQERSMRQYFRAMDVNEDGLRSSPSLGHFTIFEMAARILNIPETESTDGDDSLWQLRGYAAEFWMQHFLDIDLEAASNDDIRTVINSLYAIMDPEGEALRNIELYSRTYVAQNFFGAGPSLREQFFERFNLWLERARAIMKDVSAESGDRVVNWMNTCDTEEEILLHLARGHIMNWYKSDRSWKARYSFEFARSTLRLTKIAHGLSDDDEDSTEHAEEDILAVSKLFPDIERTAQVHIAIGMVYHAYQLYAPSLAEMQKSLELPILAKDRVTALYWIGEEHLLLSEATDDEDEKQKHIREAYEAINTGINIYQSDKEVKEFFGKPDRKLFVQLNLTNRARCEVKLGEIDKAIVTMDEAYAVFGNEYDNSLNDTFVTDITGSLEKEGNFEKLVSVVGHFHKWDMMSWLGFSGSSGHDTFQRAVWECKKQDFMVKTYENMIVEMDKFNHGAHVRGRLATAYQYVFPNYGEAKRLLWEIMDGKKGKPFSDASEDYIFSTRLQLADILVELFLASTDQNEKTILHGEMKTLALQHGLAMSADFSPYESQTTISLALMTGKMGPTSEFQTLMEKMFRGAIDALTDKHAWNDSQGFRLLSKVLAFVPEMKRDAQIAFSLQFSAVDDKLFNPPEESKDENPTEGGGDIAAAPQENPQIEKPQTEKPPTEQPEDIAPQVGDISLEDTPATEQASEELNPYSEIYCNGCSTHFSNWNEGAVYGCIVCTNCDLCENCWKKLDASNKGEPWTEWKRYCGENHKYVKGPITGWKGVNGGVMKIELAPVGEEKGSITNGVNGDHDDLSVEEIKFDDWLDGVQERWVEAWKGFWKKEELIVNIF